MSQNEKTREGRKEGTHTQAHTHTHTHTYPCGFESEDTIQRPGRTVDVPVRRSSRIAAEGSGGSLDALEAGGDEGVQLHVGGGHPH